MPPMMPTNTAGIDTGAWLEISNGRTRLSETDTAEPQISMKIAQPHCERKVVAKAGAVYVFPSFGKSGHHRQEPEAQEHPDHGYPCPAEPRPGPAVGEYRHLGHAQGGWAEETGGSG